MRAPIGSKIRSRRRRLGLTQVALARAAGISPSYLNLIEADKRQVGGSLLRRLAEKLDLALEDLTGESEQRLIEDVIELLTDPVLEGIPFGPDDARKLVAHFPQVATALARLYRGYADANANVEAYANRVRSDPLFAELLHQMLSQITAVRSGAEILETVPDLEEEDRSRFLGSINREARGLSSLTASLIEYFERSAQSQRSVSPRLEVDDLLFGENNYFPELETAAEGLRAEIERTGAFGEAAIAEVLERRFGIGCRKAGPAESDGPAGFFGLYQFDATTRTMWFRNSASAATRQFQLARLLGELAVPDVLESHVQDPRLTSATARQLAYRAMASYLAGAIVLPYTRFLAEAEASCYDIDLLSQSYSASFEQIAHRLVTLRRPGAQGIPFGFLRSDPSGKLTKHFPLPGLLLPNSGHACPLWAIYTAFQRNGQIVRQPVHFSNGSRYLFIARTVSTRPALYAQAPFQSSVMLACDALHADRTVYGRGLKLDDPLNSTPVGPACRLCTRQDCIHRQEEALDPTGEKAALRMPLVPREFD